MTNFTLKFIKIKKRTWVVHYISNNTGGHSKIIVSDNKGKLLIKQLYERYGILFQLSKQHYEPATSSIYYNLTISFDNDADEAEFIMKVSDKIILSLV